MPVNRGPVHPMGLVGHRAHKHCQARRTAQLPRDLVVLALGGEEPAEGPFAEPGGDGRVARAQAEQPVARAHGIAAVEADPGLQLIDEGRVCQLRRVALHDALQGSLHRGAIGRQPQAHALRRTGRLQQGQLVPGEWHAVVVATRALPRRDGLEQWRRLRGSWRQCDVHMFAGGVEARGCEKAMGPCCLHQVLGGATQAHEQVVVVSVHGGASTRAVGPDGDGLVANLEGPALRVVARRCQRRAAHQFARQRRAFDTSLNIGAPGRCGEGFVALSAVLRRAGCRQCCPAEDDRCSDHELPARQGEHLGSIGDDGR
jgi:hypothetical protein